VFFLAIHPTAFHIMIIFHGGCHGCIQQSIQGTDFCFDCCYFDADWSKPSLNKQAPSQADIERQLVINRRNLAANPSIDLLNQLIKLLQTQSGLRRKVGL
jgi:hypothetical protein